MKTDQTKPETSEKIIKLALFCANKGYVPATSGNFSMRQGSESFAITISGKDKGNLTTDDILLVHFNGPSLEENKTPSAETLLHVQLYKWDPSIEVVAHVHSTASTVLSKVCHEKQQPQIIIEGYELLKALSGVKTHEHREEVPIFANHQDIQNIAEEVENYIRTRSPRFGFHGYLIAGHGLYTWGQSLNEVKRHVEAFNALFESIILERKLEGDWE